MRGFIVFFVAAFLAAPAHAKESGTVVGYIAAFKGIDREMQQRGLDRYTHLMLAFVNPTPTAEVVASGGLACSPTGPDSSVMVSDAQLRTLVTNAHGSGTKVIASLGGAVIPPCGGDRAQPLAPEMRARLVANLIGMVDRYDLDGLDVDLEGDLMTGIAQAGTQSTFHREISAAHHA